MLPKTQKNLNMMIENTMQSVNEKLQRANSLVRDSKIQVKKILQAKKRCISHSPSEDFNARSEDVNEFSWIESLVTWANNNNIPEYKRNFDTGTWHGLPRDKYTLLRIKELDLSKIHLNALPDELFNLTNLKTLNLYQCQLNELPDLFEHLNKLTSINLNENNLSSLPKSFLQLKNLETLLLLKNPSLQRLPSDLVNLPKLTNFKIDGFLATQYRRHKV